MEKNMKRPSLVEAHLPHLAELIAAVWEGDIIKAREPNFINTRTWISGLIAGVWGGTLLPRHIREGIQDELEVLEQICTQLHRDSLQEAVQRSDKPQVFHLLPEAERVQQSA